MVGQWDFCSYLFFVACDIYYDCSTCFSVSKEINEEDTCCHIAIYLLAFVRCLALVIDECCIGGNEVNTIPEF